MKPVVMAAVHVDLSSMDIPKMFTTGLRRADDFIRLAVAAAHKTIVRCEERQELAGESGLFLGTAYGPMQTNFDVLALIIDEEQTSPTLFSHSVFNSAAGYVARLFNIQGSGQTLTDFSWPFFQALAHGCAAIRSGRLNRCLVLQVETYSDLLADARIRTGKGYVSWSAGAVAWLLEGQHVDATKNCAVEAITVDSHHAPPESYLHREEQLYFGQEKLTCTDPLAAAEAITNLMQKNQDSRKISCRITARYGAVTLTLRRGFSGHKRKNFSCD